MEKKWNKIVLYFVIFSLIHLVLDTTEQFSIKYHFLLMFFDGVITFVFLVDFFWKIRFLLKRTNAKISSFFSFDILIDFFSLLPFFIALFLPGLKFLAIIRLLRLLRVFKLFNRVKSNNLILNAIKNKKHELYISFQVVIIITLILSSILYFVENKSQPENFSSITDAFLWSISKFIGGIGGYGDFSPITIAGKILATFVGVLGIALFAVPAGIIASGFVEEIEEEKKNSELNLIYETLSKAFHFDVLAGLRAKEKNKLSHVRRRYISLVDACVKINKSDAEIFAVCGLEKNLKLSKRLKSDGEEEILIEYFENNSAYGTFVNRNSNITIMSPHSEDGFNLGHYSYSLAEYLQANYISIEKYGIYSFLEEKNINFNENKLYLSDLKDIDNPIFKLVVEDLSSIVKNGGYVFNLGTSMGKSPTFHILNGSEAEDLNGKNTITFFEKENAANIYKAVEELSKVNDFTITKDTHYSNAGPNHLDQFVFNKLDANAMSIKVNVEIVKGSHDKYYDTISILGESIKRNTK
jgi:voltage-gated potassium channel